MVARFTTTHTYIVHKNLRKLNLYTMGNEPLKPLSDTLLGVITFKLLLRWYDVIFLIRPSLFSTLFKNITPVFSSLDEAEIIRLARKFKKLDQDGNGSLGVEEILSLPQLAKNPLVMRVLDIFDTDKNGEIDLREFLQGLVIFTEKDNSDSKLKFCFRIYDINDDGFITNLELFRALKIMVGNNLKDEQLQQVVDKTIIYSDRNGDGMIDFSEFKEMVRHLQIDKKMFIRSCEWEVRKNITCVNF